MKIPTGRIVDAFQQADFGGTPCTFTSDVGWIGRRCNARIASLRIH